MKLLPPKQEKSDELKSEKYLNNNSLEMLTKDIAICIRTVDYSETSQIAVFFTKQHGKISAIAKGSKRSKSAFDGPIEMFTYGTILFTDSDRDKLSTLTELNCEYNETNGVSLYRNIFTLNCLYFAAELLNKLTDDYDPHADLFESFVEFLKDAKDCNEQQILSLLILFQITLLREIGLQPIFDHCVNCKTSCNAQNSGNEYYFSSSSNGLICKDCEMSFPDKIRLSKQAANCLINLKLIAQANKPALSEIEKIMIRHFNEILGYPPKMAKHVYSAL